MLSVGFEKVQAEIISRVLNNQHIADECENYHSEFGSNNQQYFQSVSRIEPDDDLFVIFATPTKTKSVFITVSDGDKKLIRRVLSNLEEMELEGKSFNYRSVIRFEDAELKKNAICAVAILPLSVSGILCDLEESFVIGSNEYIFRLVVFLSEKEYSLWKDHGFDSLMSYFDETDKDLLTFNQNPHAQ